MTEIATHPILFACTMNSIRSPMAAALFQAVSDDFSVFSAGLIHGNVDGFVISIMREINIDLSDHTNRTIFDLADMKFSQIITLSSAAHRNALRSHFDDSTKISHWPITEPALSEGSRDRVLDAYRETLMNIGKCMADQFPHLKSRIWQVLTPA